jgi:hypothetical protein
MEVRLSAGKPPAGGRDRQLLSPEGFPLSTTWKKRWKVCPRCYHAELRPTRHATWLERLALFLLLRPYRCHDCGARLMRLW